ncbi:MAG: DUF4439 domain-containing protein [Aeromicrobium sp.]|uniref:DUF4439 domain-containing protein n=1 Tax=Aeromicrobium sp. TaxID=1871063 RepID=UPI003C33EBC2
MIESRNAALIAWLALEREAVWFYPFVGARVPDVADRARSAARAHAVTRDRLLGSVVDDTTTVQPSYDVGTIDTEANASSAARRLEQRIQAACLAVVAASTGDDREVAVSGLRTAATDELGWSGRARAFPGMAD